MEEPLDSDVHKRWRRGVGKMQFVPRRRPDALFATTQYARRQTKPTIKDGIKLGEIGQTAVHNEKRGASAWTPDSTKQNNVDGWTDTNWARCPVSCRSRIIVVLTFVCQGDVLKHSTDRVSRNLTCRGRTDVRG